MTRRIAGSLPSLNQPLDMAVCKAMGLRACWVNRRNEKAATQWLPFTRVIDVAEAARLIAGL